MIGDRWDWPVLIALGLMAVYIGGLIVLNLSGP